MKSRQRCWSVLITFFTAWGKAMKRLSTWRHHRQPADVSPSLTTKGEKGGPGVGFSRSVSGLHVWAALWTWQTCLFFLHSSGRLVVKLCTLMVLWCFASWLSAAGVWAPPAGGWRAESHDSQPDTHTPPNFPLRWFHTFWKHSCFRNHKNHRLLI